ncbi:MAG: hypothetical protein AB7K71_37510 [Polyangiaceae bacterium]
MVRVRRPQHLRSRLDHTDDTGADKTTIITLSSNLKNDDGTNATANSLQHQQLKLLIDNALAYFEIIANDAAGANNTLSVRGKLDDVVSAGDYISVTNRGSAHGAFHNESRGESNSVANLAPGGDSSGADGSPCDGVKADGTFADGYYYAPGENGKETTVRHPQGQYGTEDTAPVLRDRPGMPTEMLKGGEFSQF